MSLQIKRYRLEEIQEICNLRRQPIEQFDEDNFVIRSMMPEDLPLTVTFPCELPTEEEGVVRIPGSITEIESSTLRSKLWARKAHFSIMCGNAEVQNSPIDDAITEETQPFTDSLTARRNAEFAARCRNNDQAAVMLRLTPPQEASHLLLIVEWSVNHPPMQDKLDSKFGYVHHAEWFRRIAPSEESVHHFGLDFWLLPISASNLANKLTLAVSVKNLS